jgi:mannitol/fructose-specific phosphotransferase system IIA component (Ntr-type)
MNLISEQSIFFIERQYTKPELFEVICERLKQINVIADINTVISSLSRREDISDTRIDDLIAMPHCKDPAVTHSQIVFVNCRKFPIQWSSDVIVTGIIFLMIPTVNDNQINQIPQYVRKLADPNITEELFNNTSQEAFIKSVHLFERR